MASDTEQTPEERQSLLSRLDLALRAGEMNRRALRILGVRPTREDAEAAGMLPDVIDELEESGVLKRGRSGTLKIRALRVVMALLDGSLSVDGVKRIGARVPESLLAQIDDESLRNELMERELVVWRRRSNPELPSLNGFEQRDETIAGTPKRIAAGSSSGVEATGSSSGLRRLPVGPKESSGVLHIPRGPRESSGLLRNPDGPRESSGLLRAPNEGSGLLRNPRSERSGLRRPPTREGSGILVDPTRRQEPSGVFPPPEEREASGPRRAPRDLANAADDGRTIEDTKRLLDEMQRSMDSGETESVEREEP